MTSCSIVVPTRDRADVLAGTLAALARVDVPAGWDTEVVIVENGSRCPTRELVSSGGRWRWLHLEPPGASAARNHGASRTTGEILLFLDDDVRPPENWLPAMAAPILSGEADATVGRFRLVFEEQLDWVTEDHRAMLIDEHSIDPHHPFLVAGNMAIRRDVFEALGGFEEELGPGALGAGGEDLLLTHRLQACGGTVKFVDAAPCEHWMPAGRVTPEMIRARAIGAARSEAWLAYHWWGRHDRQAFAKSMLSRMLGIVRTANESRWAWHDQMRIEQRRPRRQFASDWPQNGAGSSQRN